MNNANIIRVLNVIAVIAATVGGASTVPDLNLPKVVLAYGLFIAMVCKAVAAELMQVKGQSDESQGITPAQIAGVQAVHDKAQSPGQGLAALAPPAAVKVLAFGLLLGLGLTACSTSQVTTAYKTETAVDTASTSAYALWQAHVAAEAAAGTPVPAATQTQVIAAFNKVKAAELVAIDATALAASTTNNASISAVLSDEGALTAAFADLGTLLGAFNIKL